MGDSSRSSASRCKLNVIAEGVETQEQFTYLRLLRCDKMQGFGYSRPLSADKVTPLLIKRQQVLNEPAPHTYVWHMQPPGKREIETTDSRASSESADSSCASTCKDYLRLL